MSPATAFELLRFEATPVSSAAALVELDGVFTGPEPARPRLLVEAGGVSREMPALSAGGSSPWSASFAIPLTVLGDAAFALVPGRGPLIALPEPTSTDVDDDRFVRLARTANDLRRRLGQATEDAAAAAERLAELASERDALTAALEAARAEAAAAQARASDAHDAAVAAREEQARAEGEAEEARESLSHARDEARAAVASELAALEQSLAEAREALAAEEERAVAAEDDARAARRELVEARARIESLLRENRTHRTAAARANVPSATAEFRAARLGAEWAEGAEEDDPTAPLPGNPDEASHSATVGEGVGGDAAPEDATAAPDDDPTALTDATAPLPPEHDAAHHPVPAAEEETAAFDPVGPATQVASAEESSGGLWTDASEVRILRPRTTAGRRRPARIPVDDDTGEDVLEPAAVGARLLQPAEVSPRQRAVAILTSPRVIVGAIFFLLIVALVLIFIGAGPV
ncbi:MAG TPA: hypothetical protein VF549_20360 [Solirubrobacteraceae bacterium]|jgi:hypothetical protein